VGLELWLTGRFCLAAGDFGFARKLHCQRGEVGGRQAEKLVTQALMDLLDADKKTVAARAKVDKFVGELQKKIASRYQ